MIVDGSGSVLTVNGALGNTHTLTLANGGALNASGTLTNLSGSTLGGGGTWNLGGALTYSGSDIGTIASGVTARGIRRGQRFLQHGRQQCL